MPFTWKDKKDIFKGEGIYHLTFTVVNRVPLQGRLCPLQEGTSDEHLARIELSEMGAAVYVLFNKLRAVYPQLQILAKQVMPDHFHAVVWMKGGFEGSVKMVARHFSQGCSIEARRLAAQKRAEKAQPPTNALPSTNAQPPIDAQPPTNAHPSAAQPPIDALPLLNAQYYCANTNSPAPQIPATPAPPSLDCGNGANTLFSKPFIRTLAHAGQLNSMITYVHSNPDNAWMRRCHPDLYQIRRNVEYAGLRFDAMGKARLLDWPDRQVIALSRSLTAEQIAVEVKKALRLAESGTVTYTAAINEGEKAVAKAVRSAGYPLVIMMLDGFPAEGTESARYFHPSGIYHKLCGEGLLYIMAPSHANYDNPQLIRFTDEKLRQKAEAKGLRSHIIPHSTKRWRMIAGNVMLEMIANLN